MAAMLGGAGGAGNAAASGAAERTGWRLVWSDEFNYRGLPNPEKWAYEEGFVRNAEMQYYTKERLENARVEDGKLIIECRKEKFANPKYHAGSDNWQRQREFAQYTAASLTTKAKASWQYGRVEVRAKLPRGKGVWPAIWMLGTNITKIGWPRCGEIDIMEFVGKEPNTIHANAHFARGGKHASNGGKLTAPAPYDDFHLYAIEWFADRMDFYFDDTKYHTVKLDDLRADDAAFRAPQYLLINFALGGAWGGEIDEGVLPQRYEIDYVRVYQAK